MLRSNTIRLVIFRNVRACVCLCIGDRQMRFRCAAVSMRTYLYVWVCLAFQILVQSVENDMTPSIGTD